ncbi:MAG: ATP-binding protein, partial [Limisphaerales bacterium]
MAGSTVALLLVSAGFVTYELFTFRREMTRDLSTTAQMIGNQSTAIMTFGGTEKDASDILGSLRAKEHIVSACIYKGTNIFAAPYFRDKYNRQPPPPHPQPDGWRFDFHQNFLAGFHHIWLDGEDVGAVYLKSDLDALYSTLENYVEIIFLFMLASLAVAYLFSTRLQRIITEPIFQLAKTAKIVSTEKNYSVRTAKKADDELGHLTDGFNEMLSEIQKRDAALHDSNDKLEKRVHERTRDLQTEIAERKRAEEALQQQFTRISLLNQITYAIAARQDFESIILVVLQQLEERLPVDYASAYLFDPQIEMFNAIARAPKSRLFAEQLEIPQVIPLADTNFQPCLKGEMVYAPDNSKRNMPISKKMARGGMLSTVGHPLIVEGKMFGLLVLARRTADGFSEAEREFIRGLSAHVALAIHQAQLYQDLQKAYNELRQTQQAVMQQERLKALGQMASGVAHDINNALSPIVGFADLIARYETSLSPAAKKHLDYIKTAGEDIAHIVSRLRDFYRPRDQRELLLELSLNNVATRVIDMTRPRWRDMSQSRGIPIEVQTDFDPRLPDFVGIESEIREAITNLIINAVDALPAGGTIIIRTRVAERKPPEQKNQISNRVILEICDTGIGMDEETRRRCLEPFFSTKGHHGTGLGLAMVYGVVERHEGEIEIESKSGKGTTVRLIFPIRSIAAADTASFYHDGKSQPLHILCIDDEPLLRELIKEMLEREGHKIEMTENGEAGLNAFRAARNRGEPFDAVMTDFGMPNLDGRQVAAILNRESPETPVIMLTGWGAFMQEDGVANNKIFGIIR